MINITQQYWYHEPWVWFNLILLGLAITCATTMSIIAIQHTPAEIGSRWYQEGVLAKRERQQEVLIRQLHLQGDLNISQAGLIVLTMHHDDMSAKKESIKEIEVNSLQLYIEHPTDPELDQTITLTLTAPNQYSGQLQADLHGKRRLLVSPPSDLWYLTSSGYFPASSGLKFSPDMS